MEAVNGKDGDRPLEALESSDRGVENHVTVPQLLPIRRLVTAKFDVHRVTALRRQEHDVLWQTDAVLHKVGDDIIDAFDVFDGRYGHLRERRPV